MTRRPIPYGRQDITEEDIAAVENVLRSDFLTQGPKVPEFEDKFAGYVGSQYAVAVANGTAALHLSALALGIEPGQKVITTPITFAATANCVRFCGGDVDFVDIDPNTSLIDLERVRLLLESVPVGTYVGIIPVDFTGLPVDLENLRLIANEFSLWILEDACHAPGGYFVDSTGDSQHCGNGSFAELSIFSFHPVKHIATGEGGMITTNNEELYRKLLKLRTHGITKNHEDYLNDIDLAVGQQKNQKTEWPGWYMEMQDLGYNYRLTEMQAALGISQIDRANEGLNRRRQIAKRYTERLSAVKEIYGLSGFIEGHAYHLYVIECERRFELYTYLRAHHIYCQIHYIPTHLMPYYQNLGWREGDFPIAEKYYSGCLSLPMYPSILDSELDFVSNTIRNYYGKSGHKI